MQRLDQIGLIGHHLIDVLVRPGDLVEHALVLAAFDALGLRLEIGAREAALGLGPAHAAPGAVGAGVEGLRVALAAHDVGARAHAARDDPELAFARADRPLAGHVDTLAEVLFLLHVVVMAVDRLVGSFERREVAAQRLEDQFQHFAPVGECIVLRPADRLDVVVEKPGPFVEPGEVAVGEMGVAFLHRLARLGDEVLADAIADAAAARVQHCPNVGAFVEADLDEVVAAAERTHLPYPFTFVVALHLADLRVLANDRLEPPGERCAGVAPRAGLAVLVEAHGDRTLDRGAHAREAVGQVLDLERQAHRVHAAADVDADRRGDDRAPGGNHRADSRADAGVHVGHRRDVAEHDRQLRHVGELLTRMRLEVLGKHLDRDAAAFDELSDRHGKGLRVFYGGGNILLQFRVLGHGAVTLVWCNRRGR